MLRKADKGKDRRTANFILFVGLVLLLVGVMGSGYRHYQAHRAAASVKVQMTAHAHPIFPYRPTFTPTPTATVPRTTPTPWATLTAVIPTPTPTPTPTPYRGAPPVRLLIPALGIDTPVVPVKSKIVAESGRWFTTWETASYAAGYHVGTAYPGQPGNLVLSGHHNIEGQVFRPLSVLGNKDVPFPRGAIAYVFDANGRIFAYRLEVMYKVKERGVSVAERLRHAHLLEETDVPTLTLITCWPLYDNAYRLIVRGPLVGEVLPDQIRDILSVSPE